MSCAQLSLRMRENHTEAVFHACCHYVAVTEQLVTGCCQIGYYPIWQQPVTSCLKDLVVVSDPPEAKYYLTKSHSHASKKTRQKEMLNAFPNQDSCWNMGQRLSTCVLAYNYAIFFQIWISRFPCCVLLALSWHTNENPSTGKLSRAINQIWIGMEIQIIITNSYKSIQSCTLCTYRCQRFGQSALTCGSVGQLQWTN